MRIAGVQMDVKLGAPAHNVARIRESIAIAAQAGASLVVFPECALSGYCFESLEEASEFAEPIPSPRLKELSTTCREHNVYAIVGLLEKVDAAIFNACVCLGPTGVVASYRKVHLPHLGVDHFTTPGDRPFAVHDIGDVRIGMNICYDASFPEASRSLALLGADLIVLPTNWPPGAEQTAAHVVNARSSENKVFFIAANRVGGERGFRFIGQSKVTDVHGNTLAVADHQDEAIIYADIEPSDARNKRIERVPGKHSVDRFADRRPEFYDLVTDDVNTNGD